MENGETEADLEQLFPRCRGSRLKAKSRRAAINVGEIIELSESVDDSCNARPKIFSDKMLSPVRKAHFVPNNESNNDDNEEESRMAESASKIGIAGGREVYSMSRSRASRHSNKNLKSESHRLTNPSANDNTSSSNEDTGNNSNGVNRSSKCVVSLVPPRSSESTTTPTTRRVIGGVPIANYEGSPRRYKPKEAPSNVSTPRSKCSSASSGSSKGHTTNLCLPGFPMRISNTTSSNEENNDMDNDLDDLPPPPASFYDYAYEFSETRKVLDDFFAKDNNGDASEKAFIDLNYKLVRRPEQHRDTNISKEPKKSDMKSPKDIVTNVEDNDFDDEDLDSNRRRNGTLINRNSATLMPVLADGLSSPEAPHSGNEDDDEDDLVFSSSGSGAYKETPERASDVTKRGQSPRDSLADVAIVEEQTSFEDRNESPAFPPPPPSFPSLTLDDLGIEPPPMNNDSVVERNDSPASDPWSNPPANDNDAKIDDEEDEEEGEEEEEGSDIVEERVPTPKTAKEDDLDTDQETDRLLGEQYKEGHNILPTEKIQSARLCAVDDRVECEQAELQFASVSPLPYRPGAAQNYETFDIDCPACRLQLQNEALMKKKAATANGSASSRGKEGGKWSHSVLIEGVLFRARYLGSTQLVCEGQPTKTTRMMQAEEAVSRIKALTPNGESQPSTDVDLFISTEKIMVLNTDLKEIMMDHSLRSISYIADIGDLLVVMARRRLLADEEQQVLGSAPKMLCHVFESEEAQFIAQSIGQAFQVAYVEFLKANGIEDHAFVKEMDYQEVLNSQEIFGDELNMFAKKELQKEVVVPKAKGEILGVVIVESGWGSMLPTIVLANLSPTGPAARCGQLNIGDQIIAINGVSLVGLPLSTCQNYIKNTKNKTAVKLTAVSCPPVVEVKIKRPDTKYQLGFSVQNGVICSLLRGGIAERGGVRVGHRIIEINGQSVVAVPHERIVNLLATSIGEISMKTMPTSMFRLLTGQETPLYI